MAPEPTWQGIPIEIKELFVAYIDYKTRCRLRRCSKSERDLVDACPIVARLVSLDLDSNKLKIVQAGASVIIRDEIIDNFCKFFKQKDAKTRSVSLRWDSLNNTAIAEDLISKMETLPSIKARNISLSMREISEQELRQIIPVFDSNFVKSMGVEPKLSSEAAEYLIGTDCWKNVKSVIWHEHTDIKIDAFLHMDIFCASINTLTAVDTWNVINTFINKESLKRQLNAGEGFIVDYEQGPTEEQIVAEFKVAPRRVENPRHETDPNKSKYKYHFHTKTNGVFLVVELEVDQSAFGVQHKLYGFICEEGERESICFR